MIEHTRDGTLVRGTRRQDTDLHTTLGRHGFRYSGSQGFWYLPRPWRHATRAVRVDRLTRELERLGIAYRIVTTPEPTPEPAQASAVPAPAEQRTAQAGHRTAPAAGRQQQPRTPAEGVGAPLASDRRWSGSSNGRAPVPAIDPPRAPTR